MATILSSRNTKLVITPAEGEALEVTGFSDDDPVIEWPDDEFMEMIQGKDGLSYGNDLGMIGGPMTIKLVPVSPAIPRFLRWRNAYVAGERINFSGSYGDPNLQLGVSFSEGYLVYCPPMAMPGVDFEITMWFEKYESDADTARLQATPSSPSTGQGLFGQGNTHASMGASSGPMATAKAAATASGAFFGGV